MSEFNISIHGGESKRLLTGGKYCPADIVVTAEGGGSGDGMVVSHETTPTPTLAVSKIDKLSISFPDATTVNDYSFWGCTSLARIDLPNATTIGNYAFQSCIGLTSVDLSNATTIGSYAFQLCYCLTCIDLPNATTINNNAFWGCTDLTSLIIRNSRSVCTIDITAISNTGILTEGRTPTMKGFIYIPSSMYETYRAAYASSFANGMFDILFRKIEDYPDICG